MTHEPQDAESTDRPLSNYLARWGDDMRNGSAKMPVPPGKSDSPDQLSEALAAARGAPDQPAAVDERLLNIAKEAEATDFRPWEEIESAKTGEAGALVLAGRRRWLPAVAAAVPLLVVAGIWYQLSGVDGKTSGALAVRIGYSDLSEGERGTAELRPGTTAHIYFTAPEDGHYAIVPLSAGDGLTIEALRTTGPGRLEIEWRIPSGAIRGAEETVVVIFSPTGSAVLNEIVQMSQDACGGPRDSCIDAIHAAASRSDQVLIEHRTYRIAR